MKKTKVLFVCHGNICRSTMAESVFKHMVRERGLAELFEISSAATHTDEIGNPPHRGTQAKLREVGIPLVPHRARLLTRSDGAYYDYIIGMDGENARHMRRILGDCRAKVCLLLDFTGSPRPIADPWYTGNFDETYDDVAEGCAAFLNHVLEEV